MSNGISAHGTLISRNGVNIAEVRDITMPPLTRKALEITTHQDNDDAYVVGLRRRGDLSFLFNFIPINQTTAAASLIQAWYLGTLDAYVVLFTDLTRWAFQGYVTNFAAKAPVDGAAEATVGIRPTGAMTIANP